VYYRNYGLCASQIFLNLPCQSVKSVLLPSCEIGGAAVSKSPSRPRGDGLQRLASRQSRTAGGSARGGLRQTAGARARVHQESWGGLKDLLLKNETHATGKGCSPLDPAVQNGTIPPVLQTLEKMSS
jgi:hypothetical protein